MKRLLIASFLILLLALPSVAHADVAPPAHPPGSNLEPGAETTQVCMLAETVLIEVQAAAPSGSLGQARVTADFSMRNLGAQAESMAVRFPVGAGDGFFAVNQLSDLRVRVNGKAVSVRPISGEDPYGGSDPVPWVEFDVTFPPGAEVQIQVGYTLEATGEYPFVWFKYILASGAGWKDSIGSAEIIARLPYEAGIQNVLVDPGRGYFGTSPGGLMVGNEIRWHYEDLEPAVENNFEIDLVMPSAWQQVLAERANVEQNPNDGEAWGRLGKLYKELTFSSRGKGFRMESDVPDPGAVELYGLSVQAYEKAVTLLPEDALWHAGFAELLYFYAYWSPAAEGRDEALRSLGEIHTALELAPADPKVLQIAEMISYGFPEGMKSNGDAYDFPWLTATSHPPTPGLSGTEIAQILLTATAEAQATPGAPATPTSTPVPSPGGGLPFCSPALILPLILLAAGAAPRHRRRV